MIRSSLPRMDDFTILASSTRTLHALSLIAGLALIAAAAWLLRRRLHASSDDTSGPGSVPLSGALFIAAIPFALGIGLLWMPFQFVRTVHVDSDAFELRYPWPRSPARFATHDLDALLLVESCQLLRSGWRTRSLLELTLRSGARVDAIEGDRETLVSLAERLAHDASLSPHYEARNRELARGACVTESPWPPSSEAAAP